MKNTLRAEIDDLVGNFNLDPNPNGKQLEAALLATGFRPAGFRTWSHKNYGQVRIGRGVDREFALSTHIATLANRAIRAEVDRRASEMY